MIVGNFHYTVVCQYAIVRFRYNAERFSLGLKRVSSYPLEKDAIVEEAYFHHLTQPGITSKSWGSRKPNQPVGVSQNSVTQLNRTSVCNLYFFITANWTPG
jgi:hypothetical protein